MSFIVVVPNWDDDKCESYQLAMASAFCRGKLVLPKRRHQYKPGMQHRTDTQYQSSNIDTLLYFLQNDAGAAKWAVTDEKLKQFVTAAEERKFTPYGARGVGVGMQ